MQGTFAERLGQAIDRSGLSVTRISERLARQGKRCSPTTLNSWRQGRSSPKRGESMKVVALLEDILRVPPGYLKQAVEQHSPGSAGWWRSVPSPEEMFGD